MAEAMPILDRLLDLPPGVWKWLWGAYLMAGVVLAIVTPWSAHKPKETQPKEVHSQTAQQNVPAASASGQTLQQTAGGPTQIDRLSQSAGGNIENSIGNTVSEQKIILDRTVVVIGDNNAFVVNPDLSFDVRPYYLKDPAGGAAVLWVYSLYKSAAWSYGSSSSLISHGDKGILLTDFLDSRKFAQHLETLEAIVCLGLASGVSQGSVTHTLELSDERAVHLCGLVSRKVAITNKKAKIFGVPLGFHKNSDVEKNTIEERTQRSVVILGIDAASGTLQAEDMQRKIISAILKGDILKDFKPSDYSEVTSGNPLCYIEIKRGRPINRCKRTGYTPRWLGKLIRRNGR